jgi:hypothetical protein
MMNGNMKKIGAYKKWAGLVMLVVMTGHLFGGTGLFCAGRVPHPSRVPGNDGMALAIPEVSSGDAEGNAMENSASPGETRKCGCQKKACPTIPRAMLTSNPIHRFSEVQRQFRSECCDSVISSMTDHSLASRGDPPFLELAGYPAFYSVTPLAITCVLLI